MGQVATGELSRGLDGRAAGGGPRGGTARPHLTRCQRWADDSSGADPICHWRKIRGGLCLARPRPISAMRASLPVGVT